VDVTTQIEPATETASGGDTEPDGRRTRCHLLVVVVLGLAAYANALAGPMVFDDLSEVRDNPFVPDLSAMATGFHATRPRFVAYLSFALNHWLFGPGAVGYHAVNVAIHLATALLVYALVRITFRTPRLRGSALAPHADVVAGVAAVLFVAHPIQTQAVTYIVQRVTSLAAMFYVGAVVLYARSRLYPAERWGRRAAWYASSLVAALLATRTKEIAFTLPAAIALYELCFLEPDRGRRWLGLIPFAAVAAFIPLEMLLQPGRPPGLGALATASRVQTQMGRLEYLLTQGPVIVAYLFLILLPIGQSLDHDFPLHGSLDLEVASAGLVLASLLALAVFLLRRTSSRTGRPLDSANRLVAFGILWWFLALSVESSFIPIVDVMNEHRVYLPSVGAFAAIAVGIWFLARRLAGTTRAAPVAAMVGLGLGLVLAGATLARNRVWSSDVALWADATRKAPDKARPVLNLGTALIEAGRAPDAIAPLRRAVALDSTSGFAHAQLGAALLTVGRPSEGETELREALRFAPADPEATFNLAMLLWQTGRADEARGWYRHFLEVAPASYVGARRFAEAHARP
jgi:tetratricopeptide (TPR) repeat protein